MVLALVVVFAIFAWILGKFAWGPLLTGLQQREEFIRTSLKEAKEDRDAAEARLVEYEEKLSTAGAEAAVDANARSFVDYEASMSGRRVGGGNALWMRAVSPVSKTNTPRKPLVK